MYKPPQHAFASASAFLRCVLLSTTYVLHASRVLRRQPASWPQAGSEGEETKAARAQARPSAHRQEKEQGGSLSLAACDAFLLLPVTCEALGMGGQLRLAWLHCPAKKAIVHVCTCRRYTDMFIVQAHCT